MLSKDSFFIRQNILKYYVILVTGDLMKKYLVVIISAICIGGVFAFFIFSTSSEETLLALQEEEKVYIFQLGVFSSLDNANNYVYSSDAAIIKQVNEYFYVYGAIYSDIYLVTNLKSYYEEHNIDYSLKEVIVDSSFYSDLKSYEQLMSQTTDMEVILRTNQIILDKYAIL